MYETSLGFIKSSEAVGAPLLLGRLSQGVAILPSIRDDQNMEEDVDHFPGEVFPCIHSHQDQTANLWDPAGLASPARIIR